MVHSRLFVTNECRNAVAHSNHPRQGHHDGEVVGSHIELVPGEKQENPIIAVTFFKEYITTLPPMKDTLKYCIRIHLILIISHVLDKNTWPHTPICLCH